MTFKRSQGNLLVHKFFVLLLLHNILYTHDIKVI